MSPGGDCRLGEDMVETAGTSLPELASFLSGNAAPPLAGLLLAIAEASIPVAHLIGKGPNRRGGPPHPAPGGRARAASGAG